MICSQFLGTINRKLFQVHPYKEIEYAACFVL